MTQTNARRHPHFALSFVFTLSSFFVASPPLPAQAEVPAPVVTLSTEAPDGQWLDAGYQANGISDRSQTLLRVLRNTAALEALRALRLDQGFLRAAGEREVARPIAPEVRALFGGLQEFQTEFSAIESGAPFPRESRDYAGTRREMIQILLAASAQLAAIDQAMRYLMTDFWNQPQIRDAFWESVRKQQRPDTPCPSCHTGAGKSAMQIRQEWSEAHSVSEELAELAGWREHLLNLFHVLGVTVDRLPLYQQVDLALRASLRGQGYPDFSAALSDPTVTFAGIGSRVSIPAGARTSALKALETVMAGAIEPSSTEGRARLNTYRLVQPHLASAAKLSIDATEQFLVDLARDRALDGIALELVGVADLWEQAAGTYGWLGERGLLDFERDRQVLEARLTAKLKGQRWRSTSLKIGAVVLFAAGLYTGVSEGAGLLAVLTNNGWVMASGLAFTAAQAIDYWDARKQAEFARKLYTGTISFGSYAAMKDSIELSESAYRDLMTSFLLLGTEMNAILLAGKTARAVEFAHGRMMVVLQGSRLERPLQLATRTLTAVPALARWMKNSASARLLDPVARSLTSTRMSLRSAMDAVARASGRSLPEIEAAWRTRFQDSVFKRTLIDGLYDRMEANPQFMWQMVREQGYTLFFGLSGEYSARGDHFWDEMPLVAADILAWQIDTAAMVWILSPTRASIRIAQEASLAGKAIPPYFSAPGNYSRAARLQAVKNTAIQFGAFGFSTTAFTYGASGVYGYVTGQDTDYENAAWLALANGLYGGTFTALSSNVRYQMMSHLDQAFTVQATRTWLSQDQARKVVLSSISYRNQWFAGWHYVAIARAIGIQGDASEAAAPSATGVPEGVFVRMEGPASEDPAWGGWASTLF